MYNVGVQGVGRYFSAHNIEETEVDGPISVILTVLESILHASKLQVLSKSYEVRAQPILRD